MSKENRTNMGREEEKFGNTTNKGKQRKQREEVKEVKDEEVE